MNLVAKEFVAARDDERGVLVLSQFTGAARELTEALVVNPYDLEEASAALARRCDHVRARSSGIACAPCAPSWPSSTSTAGPARMLVDAARLRKKASLLGPRGRRLGSHRPDSRNEEHPGPRRSFATLRDFARRRVLLAFDFDGTLAPIVRDPDAAAMRPRTRRAARGGGPPLSLRGHLGARRARTW